MISWLRIHLETPGTRFHPWSRKTPRATEQLSLWAATAEPAGPRPLSSATRYATTGRSLRSAAGGQPLPTAGGRPRPAAKPSAVQIKITNLRTRNAGALCSVPGRGTEIPQATQWGQEPERDKSLDRAWTLATAGLTALPSPLPARPRGRGQGQFSPVAL